MGAHICLEDLAVAFAGFIGIEVLPFEDVTGAEDFSGTGKAARAG